MPLKFNLILLCLMLVHGFGICQHVSISSDSSLLLFPNRVAVRLLPLARENKFVLDLTSLKTLIVQFNYLYDRLDHHAEHEKLSEHGIGIRDSVIHVLKAQASVSDERAEAYSHAYGQSKLISQEYDTQMTRLAADAKRLQAQNRKSKRKSFLTGITSGLVAGVAIGFFVISANP